MFQKEKARNFAGTFWDYSGVFQMPLFNQFSSSYLGLFDSSTGPTMTAKQKSTRSPASHRLVRFAGCGFFSSPSSWRGRAMGTLPQEACLVTPQLPKLERSARNVIALASGSRVVTGKQVRFLPWGFLTNGGER